jgi:hypothetical protein
MRLVVAFSLFTWRRIDGEPRIGNWYSDHVLAAAVCALTCLFMWGELTALRVAGWVDYLPDFCEYNQQFKCGWLNNQSSDEMLLWQGTGWTGRATSQ